MMEMALLSTFNFYSFNVLLVLSSNKQKRWSVPFGGRLSILINRSQSPSEDLTPPSRAPETMTPTSQSPQSERAPMNQLNVAEVPTRVQPRNKGEKECRPNTLLHTIRVWPLCVCVSELAAPPPLHTPASGAARELELVSVWTSLWRTWSSREPRSETYAGVQKRGQAGAKAVGGEVDMVR
ncbi:uncharacterized protein LOC121597069 [Anopheles merus]|uniref:uncharacterized protein LOC121597069 n=1 Tax=Anopheles merus TaxID=30066 RepID=UPI001BE4A963|nr:uncharacterized protein LOC121597069 [Anopheles merus]